MSKTRELFEPRPGDKVVICTITDLKQYLLHVRRETRGKKVIKYRLRTQLVEDPIVEQQLLTPHGPKWEFYGFLEDVIHNVRKGLLEVI